MPLTLNNTQAIHADEITINGTKISSLYATINYVNTNSGGVSQTDFDTSIASLQSKDIAYNSTLQSHISLIDTNTTDIATHTNDIAVLNTKQLQNFNNIDAINTNLTNTYQTTTQLNSNFVSPTTLTTNQYTKTEVDGLIAGAGGASGYTDAQIDGFLSLKEDKSVFTNNVSFFPVIDLSRPTIIHQGLTLKNSTVNVEPLEGLLFSNQFGAEVDRVVSVFKIKLIIFHYKEIKLLPMLQAMTV